MLNWKIGMFVLYTTTLTGAACALQPEEEVVPGDGLGSSQQELFFDSWWGDEEEERPLLHLNVAAEGADESSNLATWVDFRTTKNWPGCQVFVRLEAPGSWVPMFWTVKESHELTEEFAEIEYPLDDSLLPFFPRRMMGYCNWQPRSVEVRYEPGDLTNPPEFGPGAAPPFQILLEVELLEPEDIEPDMALVPEEGLTLFAECGRSVETWSYTLTPEGELADVVERDIVTCQIFNDSGDLVADSSSFDIHPWVPDSSLPSEEEAEPIVEEPESHLPDHLSYVWPRGESLPSIEILIVDTP